MKKVPSTYDGKPVLPPIQYQFSVALQALPDQYEPNHDNHPGYDFISLDQRLPERNYKDNTYRPGNYRISVQ